MPLSPAAREELVETFKSFDCDGSGTVSAAELAKSIAKLTGAETMDEAQCERLIGLADSDGDKQMNFDEFLKIVEEGLTISEADNVDLIAEEFKNFDVNGDGCIDREELREVMENLGEAPTEHELDEMFREADEDNDGHITLDEFRKLCGQ